MSISTAEYWRSKKRIKQLSLPSGAVIKVRENRLYTLMLANVLPLQLLDKQLKRKEGEEAPPADLAEMIAGLKRLNPLIQQIVVEPKIIMEGEPGAGEILFVEIPDEDLQAIIRYIMGAEVAQELEPFRGEPVRAGDRHDGPAVRHEALGDP